MVLTMAYAGPRIGEAAALTWDHVDLDKRVLQMTSTVTDVRGHVSVGPPKTARARRYVPFPKLVAEALLEHSDRDGYVWNARELCEPCKSCFCSAVWALVCNESA